MSVKRTYALTVFDCESCGRHEEHMICLGGVEATRSELWCSAGHPGREMTQVRYVLEPRSIMLVANLPQHGRSVVAEVR